MKKNKIIVFFLYVAGIVTLCLIFHDYWPGIAVLGIMACIGYFRTRRLVSGSEHLQDRK